MFRHGLTQNTWLFMTVGGWHVMPEGELSYRLLSLPVYLAEKLPALESGG